MLIKRKNFSFLFTLEVSLAQYSISVDYIQYNEIVHSLPHDADYGVPMALINKSK